MLFFYNLYEEDRVGALNQVELWLGGWYGMRLLMNSHHIVMCWLLSTVFLAMLHKGFSMEWISEFRIHLPLYRGDTIGSHNYLMPLSCIM